MYCELDQSEEILTSQILGTGRLQEHCYMYMFIFSPYFEYTCMQCLLCVIWTLWNQWIWCVDPHHEQIFSLHHKCDIQVFNIHYWHIFLVWITFLKFYVNCTEIQGWIQELKLERVQHYIWGLESWGHSGAPIGSRVKPWWEPRGH